MTEEPQPPHLAETPWQQLDARVLLIDPFKTLRRFAMPGLIALVGVGASDAGRSLRLLPVMIVGAVVIGALPWLTTRYRVTPTQLQVRTGLLQRRLTTAPLDRVRSVDLESSVLHRMLGLTRVRLGTGVDETRIELDALALPRARELRGFLLARRTPSLVTGDEEEPAGEPEPDRELATFAWSWLRFAPFSLARLVVVAGAVGVLAQFVDDASVLTPESLDRAGDVVAGWYLPVAIALALVVGLLAWVVVAALGYLVQWWSFRLSRDDTSLRMTAGLLTTRSTTVEVARVRGVTLTEPVLMRLVGGAELATLATGVGAGGVARVMPPSPAGVARDVGHHVLGVIGPLDQDLVGHGPVARRRRHVAAQRRTAVVLVGLLIAATLGPLAPWLAGVAGLLVALGNVAAAESAYRNLGHALTLRHLVVGLPRAARTRTALETDGVIGWVMRQSFWQRRQGLTTLVATTAAGAEAVVLVDVPTTQAVALADAATPGLLTPFLRN